MFNIKCATKDFKKEIIEEEDGSSTLWVKNVLILDKESGKEYKANFSFPNYNEDPYYYDMIVCNLDDRYKRQTIFNEEQLKQQSDKVIFNLYIPEEDGE